MGVSGETEMAVSPETGRGLRCWAANKNVSPICQNVRKVGYWVKIGKLSIGSHNLLSSNKTSQGSIQGPAYEVD
jgi:hypothetical protein